MFRTSYVHHQEDFIVREVFIWFAFHAEIIVRGYMEYRSFKMLIY